MTRHNFPPMVSDPEVAIRQMLRALGDENPGQGIVDLLLRETPALVVHHLIQMGEATELRAGETILIDPSLGFTFDTTGEGLDPEEKLAEDGPPFLAVYPGGPVPAGAHVVRRVENPLRPGPDVPMDVSAELVLSDRLREAEEDLENATEDVRFEIRELTREVEILMGALAALHDVEHPGCDGEDCPARLALEQSS